MSELKLVLKKKWFDMIASGEKTEEYREIKPYWAKVLLEKWDMYGRQYAVAEDFRCDEVGWCRFIVPIDVQSGVINIKPFDRVTFYLGYAKDRPSMTFVIEDIFVAEGKPEWGAVPGEQYFVIKLGERL